jgi:hypothetical protein
MLMAYTAVPTTAVAPLIRDWDTKNKAFILPATPTVDKQRLQGEMTVLARQIQQQLATDMTAIEQHFATHEANVARFTREGEKYLKDAQQATASFKKDPKKKELPPQVTYFAKQIGERATALEDDALAYGTAWSTYRANPWGTVKIPAEVTADFMTRRNRVINDQKAVGTSLQKLRAAKREADSLALVINKAAMKRDIKTGDGAQRPIAAAQKIASDGAIAILALLNDLKQPPGREPNPDSVTTNANSLQGLVTRKAWPKTVAEMKNYDGVWKNAEAGYKRMTTIEANMKSVAANIQKGLRSTEMKDPTVKASLEAIAANVKAASTAVKARSGDYSKAKAAHATITTGHKAAMKRG